MRFKIFPIILSSLLFLASCQKDDDLMTPDYSATIGFKAGVSETPAEVRSAFSQPSQLFTLGQKSDSLKVTAESIPFPSRPATRAQLTTDPAQIGEIGVCAYASWNSRPLIASELYAKGADGVFRSSGNPVYWPGNPDLPIDFYVFSPCSAQGFTAPQAGATTFDYTLPSSAEDQTDLMLDVQKNIPGDYNAILPLNFRHLLTAVQVNIKSLPTGAVAKSVSISGVHSGGTLTMSENPAWSYSGELKTTYANFNGAASASFLLLPQEVVGGEMTMSIVLSEGSKERTVTAAIPARTWAMGRATAYNVAIEDYDIEFLNKTRVVDAHYCIYKTEVETTGFPADQDWTLSTPTEGVTIQLEADVNQVARQGFWTNKIIRNGTMTNESARGTNSVSGTGSTKISVWIFVPENNTTADRDIKFELSYGSTSRVIEGLTLTQKYPYGPHKWEQLDDNEKGIYGFDWNRVTNLIYPYSFLKYGDNNKKKNAEAYLDKLISDYNAGSYASRQTFSQNAITLRYYISIDYSKLNNLSGANSPSDGYANTTALYAALGGGATSAFEEALRNTYKTESGHESEHMFREKTADDPSAAPASTGTNNVNSGILGYVLRKNKCNLTITSSTSTEGTTYTFGYKFEESDLVWYLPAYNQFTGLEGIHDPVTPANYWSSTAGDGAQSYLGNGTLAPRTSEHYVRAARR